MVESDIEKRVRERGVEIEKRLTSIETQLTGIRWVGGLAGTILAGVMVALILGWIGQG